MSDTDPIDASALFAGLPGTGKTTYLALVYLAISKGSCDQLRLGSYTDDREYLERIAAELQSCSSATHTEIDEQGSLELHLDVGTDHRPAVLRIPDVSGEVWETALYERTWPESLDEIASQASGVLVFVHVTGFDDAPSISATNAAAAALGDDLAAADRVTAVETLERSHQPTQVQIVDLLQLLSDERSVRPARAAVVLSAWDLVDGPLTPAEWVSTNAPLLHQYIDSNKEWLECGLWGVSAQGGSFLKGQDRDELLHLDVVERARTVTSDGSDCPLESPMQWALRLDA